MLTIILGGPGCGKTTRVLEIIEKHLSNGVPAHRIAYLAFTTKAATEGRDRMVSTFDIDPDDIPFFRTIHSFAFRQLGLNSEQVMSGKKNDRFAEWAGLNLSERGNDPHSIPMATLDDKNLAALSLARLKQVPVADLCHELGASYRECLRLESELRTYKNESELVDFTDMLEQFLTIGSVPPLDVVIVDEAQDLSALQWRVIEKVCAGVDDVYVAGDDDQAIYDWAGADVDYFLALKGEKQILPTSYRLNRDTFDVCQNIIGNVTQRYEKNWQPSRDGGHVERVNTPNELDLDDGTWFLLARNFHHLKTIQRHLYEWGVPFKHSRFGSSVDNDRVTSLLAWETLRKGQSISGALLRTMWPLVNERYLTETGVPVVDDFATINANDATSFGADLSVNWLDAIVMPRHERNYYREVKYRGSSLVNEPTVTVSSIHGVKGGEADHVCLMTDMTTAVYSNFLKNRNAEHRVFFVGASRARHSLRIMAPRTTKHYQLEGIK